MFGLSSAENVSSGSTLFATRVNTIKMFKYSPRVMVEMLQCVMKSSSQFVVIIGYLLDVYLELYLLKFNIVETDFKNV